METSNLSGACCRRTAFREYCQFVPAVASGGLIAAVLLANHRNKQKFPATKVGLGYADAAQSEKASILIVVHTEK